MLFLEQWFLDSQNALFTVLSASFAREPNFFVLLSTKHITLLFSGKRKQVSLIVPPVTWNEVLIVLSKTHCHDFHTFSDQRLKRFLSSLFFKKKHSGFISGQIDFFWQPWQVVPAKRPNSFPLRPDNIIFLCQSYSEKINWKGRKQFWQPFHIRFTRMSGKLSLKIWKM